MEAAIGTAAMMPVAAALGRLQWADWLTTGADGLYHTPPERGWGVLTPAGLAARVTTGALEAPAPPGLAAKAVAQWPASVHSRGARTPAPRRTDDFSAPVLAKKAPFAPSDFLHPWAASEVSRYVSQTDRWHGSCEPHRWQESCIRRGRAPA